MSELNLEQLRPIMCTISPGDLKSFEQWGKLVKTWVTGKNQLGDAYDYSIAESKDKLQPVGAVTKQQFTQMLTNAGVTMSIPDKVKTFVFVQDDDSTVVVRLPSKAVVQSIQEQLGRLAAGGGVPYPLPAFYTADWPAQPRLNAQQLTTMHCQRIGEYTINTCA